MNKTIKEMEESFPKAYEAWKNDFAQDFYEFFDANSIRCSIGILAHGKFQPKCYIWENDKWVCYYKYNSTFTRKEAEDAMFNEAFKLLEEKLK